MDHKELQLRFKQISERTVKEFADYCWTYKEYSKDIMAVLQYMIKTARKEEKVAYLYLMHELVIKSYKYDDKELLRLISGKLKLITMEFAKHTQNLGDVNKVKAIIESWKNTQRFSMNFINKLNEIIEPLHSRLMLAEENMNVERLGLKYNKTFLINYMEIETHPLSKSLFDRFCELDKLESHLVNFKKEFDRLDLKVNTEETTNRVEQLLGGGQKYAQQLEEFIMKCHQDYASLVSEINQSITEIEQRK